jgi:hypothetical protein
MNRKERKRQAWLAKKQGVTHTAPWLTTEGIPNIELKKKFLSHKARTGHTPDRVWGVFGEKVGRDGWIEQIVKRQDGAYYTKEYTADVWRPVEKPEDWYPKEGGVFIKLYGCQYLFKGNVPEASVKGIEMAKTILFQTAQHLSPFTFIGLAFDFLFLRKRFWTFVDWMGDQVNHRCLRHYNIPIEEYNQFAGEMNRAFVLSVFKVWRIDLTKPYVDRTKPQYDPQNENFRSDMEIPYPPDNMGKDRVGYIVARLWLFVLFFLQQDFAYRSRVQDALGMKPKNLEQFLNILIRRETHFGVGYKWKFILRVIPIILRLEPKLKELSDAFFGFIDTEKVKMDEADIYFSLMYKSYNFAGKEFEERKVEWDKMNEEKKTVFLFTLPEME